MCVCECVNVCDMCTCMRVYVCMIPDRFHCWMQYSHISMSSMAYDMEMMGQGLIGGWGRGFRAQVDLHSS